MQIIKRFPYYTCIALLAYMPFHIFLSQSLSLLTGGLDVWKLAKDAVVALVTLFVICMILVQGKVNRTFIALVSTTTLYGLLHLLVWAIHPDIYRQSAILGTILNVRVLCFAIIGYGAIRLYTNAISVDKLLKIVVWLGFAVAALGVIQYFLPRDILTHVGYSLERGVRPAFYIDGAEGFPRIMSTLREPNALGAYLIVPATIAALWTAQAPSPRQRFQWLGVFGVMAIATLLTFSRSAWIGLLLSVGLVLVWNYRHIAQRLVRRFGLLACAFLLLVGGGLYTQRHTDFVKSYVIHSSANSQDIDSNSYHVIFLKRGLEGIVQQPFGHGPGTAGLASIQNPAGSFLTENYYVQIGYEVGIIGLALFVLVQVWLCIRLWARRNTVLGGALLASFAAYVVINMLLHIWSNEAVACQWWLLAGMALALPPVSSPKRMN
jgi:O-antigen ligase